MDWRKNIEHWLSEDFVTDAGLADVEEEALAPLVLRLATNATCRRLLTVLPTSNQAEALYVGVEKWRKEFGCELKVLYLPETVSRRMFMPDNEADRARALYQLLHEKFDLIIGSISSLTVPVPPPEQVRESEIIIAPGMHIAFGGLLERLVKLDYDDEFEVNVKGEFSRRGGIIDIFSPAHDYPARIEFWGDQVESLRSFSPETQRSTGVLQEYRIITRASLDIGNGISFFEYLGVNEGLMAVVFPAECRDYLAKFADDREKICFEQVCREYEQRTRLLLLTSSGETNNTNLTPVDCDPVATGLKKELPDEVSAGGNEILRSLMSDRIRQWLDERFQVILLGLDRGACGHIRRWCAECGITEQEVTIDVADLPFGMILPSRGIVFLTEQELFTASLHRRKSVAFRDVAAKPDDAAHEIAAYADLDEGDYAVHLVHGIGIFRGVKEIDTGGVKREVMVLEYQNDTQIYVPLWQAALVSRYIGAQAKVRPHRLGSRKWLEDKAGTARSIRNFAAELLRFQAVRNAVSGICFSEDGLEQRIFEDAFPFEETRDQSRAIDEVKHDMSLARPMDRLLCGDVGYGKTEVAIRTAFKAVSAGYQVVVAAPTTILAQQHYHNFCERFARYPYTVEMLSRFRTPLQQKEIIQKLRSGGIDIIIGTHRLFQDDVKCKKLGLVVIDEEQRFGVRQKEKIRYYRVAVDVLTMSATPIPRTLYMAMAGARDLSTIMTAPGLRLPVKTIVASYDDKLICDAIRLEVRRGGQVFFLHNRVASIKATTEKLQAMMPEIRFCMAHGQMPEDELEEVMADFLGMNLDVLVCTTIIESGMDIQNANTIIIERADRFGLAELYQLRGRVGRCNRQAFAYLLVPHQSLISTDARKRLTAIRRYTHLGAGFRLALRDLEIRGAGNLLGVEQSGYINSVGFDLYCQLLRHEIAGLKGEKQEFLPEVEINIDFVRFGHETPPDTLAAGFPPEYIPSERLRVDAYRRLAAQTTEDGLKELAEELEDRYGILPQCGRNMINIIRLKILLARCHYTSVQVHDGKVYLRSGKHIFRQNGMLPKINNDNPPIHRLRHLLDIAGMLNPIKNT